MYLVHTDESGTNFQKNPENVYNDGPYIIFGGLMVHENKYHHLERMFADLVNQKLGISDWSKNEIHAHELWVAAQRGERNIEDVKAFFEELLQLLAKMSCPLVLGVQAKGETTGSEEKKDKKQTAVDSMLHILEYDLGAANEYGVLIADKMSNPEDESSAEEKEMAALLSNRVAWRSIALPRTKSHRSKFEFESRCVFLISNLHYVPSNESLMIQIADCAVWVVRRMFTHYSPVTVVPDLNKCPVSEGTFHFFLRMAPVSFAYFSRSAQDFAFAHFSDFPDVKSQLIKNLLGPVHKDSLPVALK